MLWRHMLLNVVVQIVFKLPKILISNQAAEHPVRSTIIVTGIVECRFGASSQRSMPVCFQAPCLLHWLRIPLRGLLPEPYRLA